MEMILLATLGSTHLVRQRTITPHQHIVRYRLSKHLDFQRIRNDLFRLSINVGMDERHIVVAHDDVSQCTEPFLHTLNSDRSGKSVPEVLEFLVGRRGWYQQSVPVPSGQTTDYTGACYCRVNDRDDVG